LARERALILVVDDDEQARNMLRAAFTSAGYAVETAHDGESGLAAIRDRSPDLVLLDMVMPGLNGWGVLRRLPENAPPIVAISGEYLAPAALGLTSSLVRAYVVKPFSLRSLLATCEKVLGPREQPTESWTERRQEARRALSLAATLVSADRRPLAVGQTVDLSLHGVRLRLGMDLAPGQKVRLTLDLPGEPLPIYLLGTARWSKGGHAGIELSELSPTAIRKLEQIAARACDSSASDA
jgi:DNA-binding response OmpR family regulator